MIMCICENSLFVYRYECVSLRVLYANVYVVFRHRCAFVKRSCVCVTLCIGLVWWGGKWIDGRKWLQTYIINFSWKGRVFGDCIVSFFSPWAHITVSEWMWNLGLRVWAYVRGWNCGSTQQELLHCGLSGIACPMFLFPFRCLLLCCWLESNKKAIVLCREVLARRGPEERRDNLYPSFPSHGGFHEWVVCGKIHVTNMYAISWFGKHF